MRKYPRQYKYSIKKIESILYELKSEVQRLSWAIEDDDEEELDMSATFARMAEIEKYKTNSFDMATASVRMAEIESHRINYTTNLTQGGGR